MRPMNDNQRKAMFANMGSNSFMKQVVTSSGEPLYEATEDRYDRRTLGEIPPNKLDDYWAMYGTEHWNRIVQENVPVDVLKTMDERDVEDLSDSLENAYYNQLEDSIAEVRKAFEMGEEPSVISREVPEPRYGERTVNAVIDENIERLSGSGYKFDKGYDLPKKDFEKYLNWQLEDEDDHGPIHQVFKDHFTPEERGVWMVGVNPKLFIDDERLERYKSALRMLDPDIESKFEADAL